MLVLTLTASTNSDINHELATATATVKVNKVNSNINFNTNVVNIDYGKTASIYTTLEGCTISNAAVSVVGHPEAVISVNNNVIAVSGLNAGTYTMSVTTVVDANHNPVTKTLPITVNKVDSSIFFSKNVLTFNYGKSDFTTVTLDGCTISPYNGASVVGHPEALVSVNNNMITVSNLAVGTYTLSVVTTPDANHNSAIGTVTINVEKAPTKIKASNLKTYYKTGKDMTITLTDQDGNPIAGERISIELSNGKTYSVTTNYNGKATFKASKVSAGSYVVTLTVDSDKYSSNPAMCTLKVVKPTKLTYEIKKDKVNGGEAFTIKVKANGKYKANVKIKLLIYTGKKYKTIVLKTKKVKNYCAALYATNAFSKGTHKIKVLPYDEVKFQGSKNTKLVIKKKGKWTDPRSTIVK
jgi:hypothetical protein